VNSAVRHESAPPARGFAQQLGSGLRDPLGEILIRKGRIDRHQLEQAVAESAASGLRIGEFLLREKIVYEDDVAHALAEQFELPYTQIDPRHLDMSMVEMLSESIARRLQALPLRVTDDELWIAVADPTDLLSADELRMVANLEVRLVVTDPRSIRAGIERLYGGVNRAELDSPVATQETSTNISVIDRDVEAEHAPAIELVNSVLRRAIDLRASDVHFIPRRDGMLVRVRSDGVMRDLHTVPIDLRTPVTARLKVMGQLNIAERRQPQDGRVTIAFDETLTDLRMAVLPTTHGEEVVLRILYLDPATGVWALPSLGMEQSTLGAVEFALRQPAGAVFVCGPTGSGKTTTLYAAVSALNDGSRAIATIEDPVEASHENVVQVEVNPRAGLTFAKGLRTILRADPDVILIGEIRDLETAEIAMQAAMTGHLVLSTLHAESAPAALLRLRQIGVPSDLIATAVRCLVSQRLLRRRCERCEDQAEPVSEADVVAAGLAPDRPYHRPAGCGLCGGTGYRGRLGAYEAVLVDDDLRRLIGSPADELVAAAAARATPTLREHAARLCESGLTTVDELRRVCGTVQPPFVPE
jgi:type IV pilus assembly protein PilB